MVSIFGPTPVNYIVVQMREKINNLLGKKNTALITALYGVLILCLSGFVLFCFGELLERNELGMAIVSVVLILLWLSLPLASIFGVVSGYKCLKKHGYSPSPAMGIGLHLILFVILLLLVMLFCFFVFYVARR